MPLVELELAINSCLDSRNGGVVDAAECGTRFDVMLDLISRPGRLIGSLEMPNRRIPLFLAPPEIQFQGSFCGIEIQAHQAKGELRHLPLHLARCVYFCSRLALRCQTCQAL